MHPSKKFFVIISKQVYETYLIVLVMHSIGERCPVVVLVFSFHPKADGELNTVNWNATELLFFCFCLQNMIYFTEGREDLDGKKSRHSITSICRSRTNKTSSQPLISVLYLFIPGFVLSRIWSKVT